MDIRPDILIIIKANQGLLMGKLRFGDAIWSFDEFREEKKLGFEFEHLANPRSFSMNPRKLKK